MKLIEKINLMNDVFDGALEICLQVELMMRKYLTGFSTYYSASLSLVMIACVHAKESERFDRSTRVTPE